MDTFKNASPISQDSLSEQKQALLKLLLQKKGIHVEQRQATIPHRPSTVPNCISFAQQRLWFLAQLEGASRAYNMPALLRLRGELAATCLHRSLETIVQRHDILRTTFQSVEGRPMPVITPKADILLSVIDLQTLSGDVQTQEAKRRIVEVTQAPFDLGTGPLLRTHLIKLQPQDHLLVITLHHIIFDGWSIGVFVRELSALYTSFLGGAEASLPKLPIQYGDFAHWQRQWLQGEVLDRQLQYWRQQLAGVNGTSFLDLPTDHPRPAIQTYQGAKYEFIFPDSLAQSLKQLSQDQGVTLFMTLLGAFAALMGRYSGQEDIVIGSPIANRTRPELEPLIGFFANTLALRINLEGNPTFLTVLKQVQETTLQAYDHQDLPFEMLVEHLNVERTLSHNPLFQVMFALQNTPIEDLELSGLQIQREALDSDTTHFDLSYHLWEHDDGLRGFVTYRTDLFEPTTVVEMVNRFQRMLVGVVADPTQSLGQLPFLSDLERQYLFQVGKVEDGDNQTHPLDIPLRVHQLWDAQVISNPDAIALISQDQSTSYGALNIQANQLARHLGTLGIQPGQIVGLYIESPFLLIKAVLGILKVGGAFFFIEPTVSPDTVSQVCHGIRPTVILTQTSHVDRLVSTEASESWQILNLDAQALTQYPSTNPPDRGQPKTPVQVLYASHRRLHVTHQTICERIAHLQKHFPLTAADVCLSPAFLTQETGILEVFWTFWVGGRLVVPAQEDRRTPSRLRELMEEQSVSVLHGWREGLNGWVHDLEVDGPEQEQSSLRWIFYRGMPFTAPMVAQIKMYYRATIAHLHTLPETGLIAARCDAPPYDDYPQTESQSESQKSLQTKHGYTACQPLLVLDRSLQLVPSGVRGEIYVSGTGLVREEESQYITTAQWVQLPIPKANTYWLKTGRIGQWLADGTLQFLDSGARQDIVQGVHVELQDIEVALLANAAVKDCRVLVREADSGAELSAYVVLSELLRQDQLRLQVQADLPPHLWPSSYVLLSSLPIDPAGNVDEAALMTYPLLDPELAHRWEQQLSSLPGVDKLAVVLREATLPQKELPLPALLPELFRLAPASQPLEPERPQQGSSAPALSRGEPTAAVHRSRPLAISDGGPLVIPESAPMTLTAAFMATATHYPHRGMVFVQPDGSEVRQSYRALLDAAKCRLAGLMDYGLKAGDRVILQILDLQDYFATLWACILGGIIPVTVAVAPTYDEHHIVTKKLLQVWALLGQPIILASDELVDSIQTIFEATPDVPQALLAIGPLAHYSPISEIHASCPDDVAFLQLTSGSTGRSKAVQETHKGIITHIHAAQQFNGYQPTDISLNWLPLDHVVPILTCHFKDIYLGCQQIEVPTALILNSPLTWLDLLERYQVTHTWSPNFGCQLVNHALENGPDRCWDLSSMKAFMNAGEQVTRPVVQTFMERVAPFGVALQAMQPAFGMAEVCTTMTYQNEFGMDGASIHRVRKTSLGETLEFTDCIDGSVSEFVDLGPPVPGVQIRIVAPYSGAAEDPVLPEGVIGQLQIKGTVVTPGYLDNPEANREAFVGSGWFNSGDLGFILNGRLTLTGREKEQIVVNGVNYYCYEIEDIVSDLKEVKPTYVAACGVENSELGTEALALFFVPTGAVASDEVVRRIRTHVAQQVGIAPAFVIPMTQAEFPKTTSGKIQRQHLKQQLLAGKFGDRLQFSESPQDPQPTLPHWFYRKIWQRRQAAVHHPSFQVGPYLVFTDRLGLGEALCQELQQKGQLVIRIETGTSFQQVDATHYRLIPHQAEGYRLLLESLANQEICIQQVLHLWNYEPNEAPFSSVLAWQSVQERGVYSLMLLVQALAKHQGGQQPVQVQVISNQTQSTASDEGVSPAKAAMVGLIKTISQEFPWIRASHLDLPIQPPAVNCGRILQECQVGDPDQEVAYRAQHRWVARLKPVEFPHDQLHPLPFKTEGLYLISGGLGGIGVEIAKFLLQSYQARVILVGRTPLPEGEPTLGGELKARWRTYQNLQQLGGDCLYRAVDIANLEQLQQVVEQAESHWQCSLDGVIHLAGVFRESLLQDETPAGLATALHPKVAGTWALHQLLQPNPDNPDPDKIFISFSSVNSFFGGFAVGAYAAANCVLEAFAQEQQRQGTKSYCFAWSRWDGVGMSQDPKSRDIAQARGYCALTPDQGLHSFLAALQQGSRQLWVGLDDRIPNIRSHLATAPRPLHHLTAFFTGQPEALDKHWSQEKMCDRFGIESTCECVHLPEMPLTEAGEIDRERLVRLGHPSMIAQEQTAPRTAIECQVAQIWQDILGLSQVGVEDNFFSLGGHSLLATQLVYRLGQQFAIDLPIQCLFEHPTLAELSTVIETQLECPQPDGSLAVASIQPGRRPAPLPLSFAQERLWFLDQLEDSNSATYNMPTALQLTGDLQIDVLERSIAEIVHRHEVLRTTFSQMNGVPVQVIATELTVPLTHIDLRHLSLAQQQTEIRRLALEEAHRPFDLQNGPLLRITLLELSDRNHVLLVTIHHICSDGWSVALYTQELSALYPAFAAGQPSPLTPLPIQYADFAVWQHQQMDMGHLNSQLTYWQDQLRGAPPLLQLPTDQPRLPVQRFRGQALPLAIEPSVTQALAQLCSATGATLFMGLLAAFTVVLHYHSGQDELVVGTDVANRNRAETEPLIGFFVNQLALRFDLSHNPTFKDELLAQVRTQSLAAYANQDLPFVHLVKTLKIERSLSYNPVFQAKLVLQNTPPAHLDLPGLAIERLDIEHQTTSYDLLLNLEEHDQGLVGSLRYSTDLFLEATIAQLIEQFQTVLQTVTTQPKIQLAAIEDRLRETEHQRQKQAQTTLEQVSLQKLKRLRRRSR